MERISDDGLDFLIADMNSRRGLKHIELSKQSANEIFQLLQELQERRKQYDLQERMLREMATQLSNITCAFCDGVKCCGGCTDKVIEHFKKKCQGDVK